MNERQDAPAFPVSSRDANPFPVSGTLPSISIEEIVGYYTKGEWGVLLCL